MTDVAVEPSGVIPIQESQRDKVATYSLGMIVFLGSWTMMFAALFFIYLMLRVRAPMWPPIHMDLPLLWPGVNTAVVALSSYTLHRGAQAARGHAAARFGRWLYATLALGIVFIALQLLVWVDLWQSGFELSSGIYGGIFYTLTVFHGLHVMCGLVVLLTLVPAALRPAVVPRRVVRINGVAMFWHFVGVVWLFMFLSVYVL